MHTIPHSKRFVNMFFVILEKLIIYAKKTLRKSWQKLGKKKLNFVL